MDADQRIETKTSPNWDREKALLSAGRQDTEYEVERLFRLATGTDPARTLRALMELAARPDWSSPARETVLFQFTNQLRTLPPFSIDSKVLGFLLEYRNQTLVAHEESSGMAVPLYPIRATAQGLVHQWTRQQATLDAAVLITGQPGELVDLYARNRDPNIRSGIETAIGLADPDVIRKMLDYAMPLLVGRPELTGLLGKLALESGDRKALAEVFVRGRGHKLVEISRQASQHFNGKELGLVLLTSIDAAPVSTGAMLIAQLTPYSIGREEVGKALLQKLHDPALGSSAALALARWGSGAQKAELKATLENDPSSLAAIRLRTALAISPSTSEVGRQR